jgi:hypothetical protein
MNDNACDVDELDDEATKDIAERWKLLDEWLSTDIGSPRVQLIIEEAARLRTRGPKQQQCRVCGCTQDCGCLDVRTQMPCRWIESNLCSACRWSGQSLRRARATLKMSRDSLAVALRINGCDYLECEQRGRHLPDRQVFFLRVLLGDRMVAESPPQSVRRVHRKIGFDRPSQIAKGATP